MVHAYSLIHDDLPAMDDDELRRGRPTCHVAFGEATAILAGDALLTLAFEILARHVRPEAVAARCCAALAKAAGATQLVGGQADYLAGEFSAGGIEELESIHRRKTGALIQASVLLGALAAGVGGGAKLAGLERYGAEIGLAFQIQDDILDVEGDPALLGKSTGADAAHSKPTYPSTVGLESARVRARGLRDSAIAALAPLDGRGTALVQLANLMVNRAN